MTTHRVLKPTTDFTCDECGETHDVGYGHGAFVETWGRFRGDTKTLRVMCDGCIDAASKSGARVIDNRDFSDVDDDEYAPYEAPDELAEAYDVDGDDLEP